MDYEVIASLISTVAFPIVMCLLMFKYMQDETKAHSDETAALKDAINKLEVAISTLISKLS